MNRVLSLLCALAVTLATAVAAAAQNNAYGIDDECFLYFSQADKYVGDIESPEFDKAMVKLLETSLRKNDKKAQTLYYVMELKRTSRQGQAAPASDRDHWNQEMESKRKDLMEIALSTGYKQYYYYAFNLTQTYYYNTDQYVAAIQTMNELADLTREAGDEYGLWQSTRFLSQLYLRMSDNYNARYYLLQAVSLSEKTQDETIRRQNLTRQYMDLAETYAPASDTARYYLAKAEEHMKVYDDTVRMAYYKAQLAIWDKDRATYERCKAFCLNAPGFSFSVRQAEPFFTCLELLSAHAPTAEVLPVYAQTYHHQQKYFAKAFAEHLGEWHTASLIADDIIYRIQSDLSYLNTQRLDEISAQHGNAQLSLELAKSSEKLARNTLWVAVLLTIVLLVLLGSVLVHLHTLKRGRARDEARIAELQEANEKVRLADAAKTRFVQNMSHEVRTPLNAIVGFSQLLSLPDGSFPEEEKEEFAGHIVNNTKMLTMLLDDILNASAMDEGHYKITYEEGEVHFMAQAAISSAEHRLQPGVRLYYAPEREEPFTFTTDPRRVQQILINLITNACKHTPSGEIKVASSLTDKEGYVSYSVTDTGTGIPADQAEKIFDRFTKLNDFVQGTGLGLSICRDIASRMGAYVYLDTTYTTGSRFIFQVPVTPPDPS